MLSSSFLGLAQDRLDSWFYLKVLGSKQASTCYVGASPSDPNATYMRAQCHNDEALLFLCNLDPTTWLLVNVTFMCPYRLLKASLLVFEWLLE